MKRLAILLLWVCAACPAAKQPAVAREPLVEPSPAPPDETPEIRAMLEPYLSARWAFDYETSEQYVTSEDAEHPWYRPLESFYARQSGSSEAMFGAHEFQIVAIDHDGDEARAVVELVGPDIVTSSMFHMRRSIRIMKAMHELMKQPQLMNEKLAEAMPPRRLRKVTYILRKTDGDWRVFMNWAAVYQIDEAERAARSELLEDFEGSERSLVQETFAQKAVDDETEALVRAINDAERHVQNRDFVAAMDSYNELLAQRDIPAFVGERRAKLDEFAARHAEKLARASIEIDAPREVDGKYYVTVKNGGAPLDSVRIGVEWLRGDETELRTQSERKFDTGSSREVEIRRTRGTLERVRLINVRFEDHELEKKYSVPSDPAFRMKLQDLRTGGASRASAGRVAIVVDDNAEKLDRCPWPDGPRDVRIEVEKPGKPDVARLVENPNGEFGQCVSAVISGLEFPLAANNRSIVRIYPPDHWFRR